MNALRRLVASKRYKTLASKLLRTTGAGYRLTKTMYPVELKVAQRELDAARVDATDIERTLFGDQAADAAAFCVAYQLAADRLSLGEEFNPAEPPDPYDGPTNVVYVGHSHTWLTTAVALYLVLKTKPQELLGYLKATRTPHAAKMAPRLKRFFAQVSKAPPAGRKSE